MIQSLIGVCDQGAVALGSVVPILILGRLSGTAELGLFSLSMSIVLFWTITQDALILSSYPIFHAQNPSASRIYTFYVLLYAAVSVCGLILLFLLLDRVCSVTGERRTLCLALDLIPYLPPIILRHFFRQLSVCRNDLAGIFLLDIFLLILQTSTLLLLASIEAVDARNVCAALAATAAIYVIIWLWQYRHEIDVQVSGLINHLKRCTAFGWWASAAVLWGSMPYYLFPWLLAVMYGTEETAIYAAASTVVGLAQHGLVGLTKGLAARTANAYRRGGIIELEISVKQACRIVLPALGAMVAFILIAAWPLAALVLPDRADNVAIVVRILALATMPVGLQMIIGNGLWATGRPQTTFFGNLIRGIVGLGLGILIGIPFGAAGCAVALLLGNISGAIILFAKSRREYSSSNLHQRHGFGHSRMPGSFDEIQ